VKQLVVLGSLATIAFGVWHFTVPSTWNWYSYIASDATELVAAVRAINVFFSLSLVLFGVVEALIFFGCGADSRAAIIIYGATCLLWLVRVIMQTVYPQGALYPGLRWAMLGAFATVFLCHAAVLAGILFRARR
jgi:hypothetical protein